MSEISATVVQASTTVHGKTVWTMSLKYGLIVHAELLRHRLLAHSVKSNRAIEPHRIRREVIQDPYIPVKFGGNQRGMIAKGESMNANLARKIWLAGRYLACGVHWCLDKLGIHKEVCNRVLNPWQWVRETMTFTEADNLFNLRLHFAAQKDIQQLVLKIKESMENYENIMILSYGDWHVPYVTRQTVDGKLCYFDNNGRELSAEEAKQCSMARCARSSYDNHDGTKCTYDTPVKPGMRTDKELYESLMVDRPLHASPGEHVATPMAYPVISPDAIVTTAFAEKGVTHVDSRMRLWSGNLQGWIQARHLMEGESCWNYQGQ